MEAAKHYVKLIEEEVTLKARLEAIKEERAITGEEVLAYFEQKGIAKLTVDGRTLFPKFSRYAGKASGVSTDDVLATLHAEGWEEYAPQRVNWPGLSAVFRERDDEDLDPVPANLRAVLTLSQKPEVGHRKA